MKQDNLIKLDDDTFINLDNIERTSNGDKGIYVWFRSGNNEFYTGTKQSELLRILRFRTRVTR